MAGVWRMGLRVSGWGQDVAQSLSWYLARVRAGLLMLRLRSECVECTRSCLGGAFSPVTVRPDELESVWSLS